MTITKIDEFAQNGEKSSTGLNLINGFPAQQRPQRRWFNWLFNTLASKINEIIDAVNLPLNPATINQSGIVSLVNDLVSGGTDKALTAEQGKILKLLIDNPGSTSLRIVNIDSNTKITYDDKTRIAIIEMTLWSNRPLYQVLQNTTSYSNVYLGIYDLPIPIRARLSADVYLLAAPSTYGDTQQSWAPEAGEWLISVMPDGFINRPTSTTQISALNKLAVHFRRWTGSTDEPITAKAVITVLF